MLQEGLRISQAIFLGLLLTYFETPDPGDTEVTWKEAYIYAAGWTICYALVVFLDNLAFHKSFYYGLKMRVANTSLIYRKVGWY